MYKPTLSHSEGMIKNYYVIHMYIFLFLLMVLLFWNIKTFPSKIVCVSETL